MKLPKPFPKSHWYPLIEPEPAVDALLLKLTFVGKQPDALDTVKLATGLQAILTVCVMMLCCPALFITFRETV